MNKRFLISLGISILIVVVYLLIMAPGEKEKQEAMKKNETQVQTEIKELQAKIYDLRSEDTMESIQTEIRNLKQEIMQESANFPSDPGIANFLSEVSTIGESSGLQILLFQPLESSSEGVYEEIPIKIRIRGTYKQVANFFYGIANLNRIVKVQELKITGPINNSGIIMTESDILITTYRMLGGA
jgi:type IV pilus assembly protein PilO